MWMAGIYSNYVSLVSHYFLLVKNKHFVSQKKWAVSGPTGLCFASSLLHAFLLFFMYFLHIWSNISDIIEAKHLQTYSKGARSENTKHMRILNGSLERRQNSGITSQDRVGGLVQSWKRVSGPSRQSPSI